MDKLGVPALDISQAKKLYAKSVQLACCSPPLEQDPRTHLNGYYVSLRKVQKHQELARREALKKRQAKLCQLIECDRKAYQSELLAQGLTLYTDTLW